MRFRTFFIRASILLLLICIGILFLKYRLETYQLSSQLMHNTLDKLEEQFPVDSIEVSSTDLEFEEKLKEVPINFDSIQIFAQNLDSILEVFQETYRLQKMPLPSTSNQKVKFDPKKKRILLTGDSMGDCLFFALLNLRKSNSFQVIYKPWYSSKISQWASRQLLTDYIQKYRPHLVIFTLGSNELFFPISEKKAQNVQKILQQVEGTEFVWVGPPNWKKDWGLDSLVHAQVGSSHYFVSKDLKFKRRGDGAHPTIAEGTHWTDTLARWMNKSVAYEFHFENLPPRNAEVYQRLCP